MIAIIEFNLFNRLLKYGEIEFDARSIINSESPSIQELDSKTPSFEEDFEIVAIKLNVAIDNKETLIIRPENILEVHPISELGSRQLQPKIFSWIDLKEPLFEKEINELRVNRRMELGKRAFQAIITLSNIDGNLLDDKSKLINDFENGLKYRLFGIEVKDNSIVADIIKGDLLSGYGFKGFTNIYASILYYRYLYSNIGNKKNGFEDWSVFFDYVDDIGFGEFDSKNPGIAYVDSNIEKDLGGALDKFDFVVVATFMYYRDLIQKNTLSSFKQFISHLPQLDIDNKEKVNVAYMIGYFFGYSELFEGILELMMKKKSIGFVKSQIIENHKLESEYNGAEKESSSSENENAGILVEDFEKKIYEIAKQEKIYSVFTLRIIKNELLDLGFSGMISINEALGIDLSKIHKEKWGKIDKKLRPFLMGLKSLNESSYDRRLSNGCDNKEPNIERENTPYDKNPDVSLAYREKDAVLIVENVCDEFEKHCIEQGYEYDMRVLSDFLIVQIEWFLKAITNRETNKKGEYYNYKVDSSNNYDVIERLKKHIDDNYTKKYNKNPNKLDDKLINQVIVALEEKFK